MKGNSTAAGLAEARKLLGSTMLTVLAPDVILSQESPWVITNTLTRLKYMIDGRKWMSYGTKEAFVMWDSKFFNRIEFLINKEDLIQLATSLHSEFNDICLHYDIFPAAVLTRADLEGVEDKYKSTVKVLHQMLRRMAIVILQHSRSEHHVAFISYHHPYVDLTAPNRADYLRCVLAFIKSVRILKFNEINVNQIVVGGDFNFKITEDIVSSTKYFLAIYTVPVETIILTGSYQTMSILFKDM